MVLIGDGIEYTDNSRNYKCFTGSHNCVKSPKEEKVKDCIFSNMGTFFNKKIEGSQSLRGKILVKKKGRRLRPSSTGQGASSERNGTNFWLSG